MVVHNNDTTRLCEALGEAAKPSVLQSGETVRHGDRRARAGNPLRSEKPRVKTNRSSFALDRNPHFLECHDYFLLSRQFQRLQESISGRGLPASCGSMAGATARSRVLAGKQIADVSVVTSSAACTRNMPFEKANRSLSIPLRPFRFSDHRRVPPGTGISVARRVRGALLEANDHSSAETLCDSFETVRRRRLTSGWSRKDRLRPPRQARRR